MASLQNSQQLFDPIIYPTIHGLSKSVEPVFEASFLYALFVSFTPWKLPLAADTFQQSPATAILLIYVTTQYFGTHTLGTNIAGLLPFLLLFLLPSSVKPSSGTELYGHPLTLGIVFYVALTCSNKLPRDLSLSNIVPVLPFLAIFAQFSSGLETLQHAVIALLFCHFAKKTNDTGSELGGESAQGENETRPQPTSLFAAIYSHLAEHYPVIKSLAKPLGPYFKVGFYLTLAWNSPLRTTPPSSSQPWLYCSLLVSPIFISTFAPTSKFYGPLRFAYLQHTEEITGTYKILLKWWVYTTYTPIFSPVIFPLYTAALVSLTAVHAFKIYRRYCENVQGITSAVQSSLSKATIARTHSSDLTAMARQHESQMLTVLATARRDKINATKVRVTDFFDIRARAWSSISTVKKPIERIVEGTKEVVDSTKTVDETEKPEDVDGLAQYLVEQAKLAQENAEKVDEELEVAQTAVTLAQKAIEDDEKARKAAKEEFNSASTALKNLQRSLTRVEAELLTISGHVEDTKGLAEKAVIIATEGDMEKADKAKVSAADAAESAEKGKTTLAERAKEVRSVLVGFLQSVEIPDTQTFGTV